MSEDTTTQSADTKSTSQPPSWQESEHPFVNLHLVFWLILMTPSIVSLAVIWLLANMSHNVLVSVLTQVESGASTKIRGGEVQHTGVVPFLKKFESTVQMLYAKRYQRRISYCPLSYLASRNPKTSSSSKTTKEPKTTESENSTTVSS